MLQCSKTRISAFDSGQVVLHQSWAPDWWEWKWLLWSTWLMLVLPFGHSNPEALSLTRVRVSAPPVFPGRASCAPWPAACVAGWGLWGTKSSRFYFREPFYQTFSQLLPSFNQVQEVSAPFLLELADSRAAAGRLHLLQHTARRSGWDWLSA